MMMMVSTVVCVLFLALSGFQQHVATWPAPTVQVRVGENVSLQCPLLDSSNSTMATSTSDEAAPATLSWYRKTAGLGPMLLLSLMPSNGSHVKYGNGIDPEKVSATANGSLLLQGSKESDSGVYYCGISYGSEWKQHIPSQGIKFTD
ncbi:secreted immunoglobulin domain 1 [Melanotaenia boesemani]|uniref:secreted immunoglobulin domain 1 n=1 Tax=Melanotaenia boesemani TaxID=1250792 RepID=UPI001C0498E9|nr:secreted immunoglobulin domain 1 [Melanotaenia boesemani]